MKACRAFDPGSNPGPGVDLQVRIGRGSVKGSLSFPILISLFSSCFSRRL
jgi:hypothetical protein